jgi:hypothetical protein
MCIANSVGRLGINNQDDVKTVQSSFSCKRPSMNRYGKSLTGGRADPDTLAHIESSCTPTDYISRSSTQ